MFRKREDKKERKTEKPSRGSRCRNKQEGKEEEGRFAAQNKVRIYFNLILTRVLSFFKAPAHLHRLRQSNQPASTALPRPAECSAFSSSAIDAPPTPLALSFDFLLPFCVASPCPFVGCSGVRVSFVALRLTVPTVLPSSFLLLLASLKITRHGHSSSPTQPPTHTQPLTHSATHSLSHPLSHPRTHSLTQPLTHPATQRTQNSRPAMTSEEDTTHLRYDFASLPIFGNDPTALQLCLLEEQTPRSGASAVTTASSDAITRGGGL